VTMPSPRTVQLLLWVVCLGVAFGRGYDAYTAFDNPPHAPVEQQRSDGNFGHTLIDFGGQWMMGRMVLLGRERELYHRDQHWKLAWDVFPREHEAPERRQNAFPKHLRNTKLGPDEVRHDAEQMMYWFMGKDSPRWQDAAIAVGLAFLPDGMSTNPFMPAVFATLSQQKLPPEVIVDLQRPAVGGPLYPPIHAFLYVPVALDPNPQRAYHTFQMGTILLTFVAGRGIRAISRGRIAWPLATLAVFCFPGYQAGLQLGQNHVGTLTILVWGWALAVRGRDKWGGAFWGLLAIKPTWGAFFFLLPLLLRRWRFCGTMILVGIGLCLATLPFVGVQSWLDWLAVGREAAATYEVNENWIMLSRDLGGIPRRLLLDFKTPVENRKSPLATALGWSMWTIVITLTISIYNWRGDRRLRTGLGAGFLALGAYLVCYRFIYYDAVLALLPLAILFSNPSLFRKSGVAWPTFRGPVFIVVLLYLIELALSKLGLALAIPLDGDSKITIDFTIDSPWDTLLVLVLWACCGWRLVRYGDRGEPVTPREVS